MKILRNLLSWSRAALTALPAILAIWGLAVVAFLYGSFAATNHAFPSSQVDQATLALKNIAQESLTALGIPHWPYMPTKEKKLVIVRDAAAMAPGVTLLTGLGPNGALFGKLVDADGRVLHAWDLDFFRLWPNPSHLPPDARPKTRPGTVIHGAVLDANGDLTFNFDGQGLMKVDFCDRPVWRLPLRTHHSVERDDQGDYWASEFAVRDNPIEGLSNHPPPIPDYAAIEVSPAGKLMRKIDIYDLLQRNGYPGALYLQSNQDDLNLVHGDGIHLNQVEVFPTTMPEGLFKHGDVLISLRNINSIIVFDPNTLAIRAFIFGKTVRQHDAHFVDGWTVSALDNNNVNDTKDIAKLSSRIVTYSLKDGTLNVVFEGSSQHPFFTRTMGKQQWLANGDILITETLQGRAFEVTPDKRVVWEYFNQTGRKGELGVLTQATRLSPDVFPQSKISELAATCPTT
jgi:hypothetical protein